MPDEPKPYVWTRRDAFAMHIYCDSCRNDIGALLSDLAHEAWRLADELIEHDTQTEATGDDDYSHSSRSAI